MANKEHVKILEQGVEVWNTWQEENPDVRPDLSNANLRGANLVNATLVNATLVNATLVGATLAGATLVDANLVGADLTGSHFGGATLDEMNLAGAKFKDTHFFHNDLSQSLHLERAIHEGSSNFDWDTIKASKGQIPETFLRGVCKPEQLEEMLAYRNSILAESAQIDPNRTIIRTLQTAIASSGLPDAQKSEAEGTAKEAEAEVKKPKKERTPGKIKAALDRMTGIAKSAGTLSKTTDAALVNVVILVEKIQKWLDKPIGTSS